MKKIAIALLTLLLFSIGNSAIAGENAELEGLQGKWVCKKTENGQKVTMTVEIKKDKLKFVLDGDSALVAIADVKLDKSGAFKTLTARNIRAGGSEDSLDDVDEEYAHVYKLDGDTLYVLSNLDRDRDQAPSLDVYKKQQK